MSKIIVTEEDAKKAIGTPKTTLLPMNWIEEKLINSPSRYKFLSACLVMKTSVEDLYFNCNYKAAIYHINGDLKVHENIGSRLLYKDQRVSAIEYCQSNHKNKVGTHLPYFGKTINGLHRHIFVDGSDKYAEPISIETIGQINLENIINLFCFENNLTILGGYKAPFEAITDQLDLFLN